MHIHSFLPVLGLSLATIAAADDSGPTFYHGAIIFNNNTAETKRDVVPATPVRRGWGKRATPTICADLPPKWSYSGCYTDSQSSRALSGPHYSDNTGLAEEKCIEYCDAHGFSVAGVEYGQECWCGYSVSSSSTKASESDCNFPCSGNKDEACGAADRINIFTNGDAAPTVLPQAGDFTSLGCYSDSASARTLTTRMSLSGNVRVTDCTQACSAAGFTYAGLEYGNECYCGSSISNGGALISDSSCDMACSADHTQLCGGAAAINIYKSSATAPTAGNIPDGWTSKSCYTDSVSHRTLAQQVSLSSVTVESCLSACKDAGYQMAGLEYGSECFCGNTIDNGATQTSSGCDMACNGNKAEVCGGAAHINIYQQASSNCNLPGCFDGTGLINEIYASLPDCLAACNADPTCVDIQYSHNAYQPNVCNLFNVPRTSNYEPNSLTYYYDYCSTYSFYDKTCVA